MRILHLANSFSEGGVEALLSDVLPLQTGLGHRVDLLVLNKNRIALKKQIEAKGIHVFVGKYIRQYNPLNIGVICKYMKGYDIVHTHLYPTQLYAVIAKLFCKDGKVKLITTEHNTYNHRRDIPVLRWVDKWMYRRYDKIIAISRATRDNLYEWAGVDSEIVYNGIFLSRFNLYKDKTIKREQFGIASDAIVLIMVARFSEQKDQATVIKAISKLPEQVHLILVGTGEEMNKCIRLTQQLKVDNRVHFIGYTPNPEYYIAISDIGILSSYWEGFGISVVEYMAMHKPVIVSKLPGVGEVVGEAAITVEPQDVREMIHAVTQLMQDRNFYSLMADKALERSAKFDISNTVKCLDEVYQDVLRK